MVEFSDINIISGECGAGKTTFISKSLEIFKNEPIVIFDVDGGISNHIDYTKYKTLQILTPNHINDIRHTIKNITLEYEGSHRINIVIDSIYSIRIISDKQSPIYLDRSRIIKRFIDELPHGPRYFLTTQSYKDTNRSVITRDMCNFIYCSENKVSYYHTTRENNNLYISDHNEKCLINDFTKSYFRDEKINNLLNE